MVFGMSGTLFSIAYIVQSDPFKFAPVPMMAYGEVGVWLHTFFTLALALASWYWLTGTSASSPETR